MSNENRAIVVVILSCFMLGLPAMERENQKKESWSEWLWGKSVSQANECTQKTYLDELPIEIHAKLMPVVAGSRKEVSLKNLNNYVSAAHLRVHDVPECRKASQTTQTFVKTALSDFGLDPEKYRILAFLGNGLEETSLYCGGETDCKSWVKINENAAELFQIFNSYHEAAHSIDETRKRTDRSKIVSILIPS